MWRPSVARARALLDARIAESLSLDELAAQTRLDKFRLCRAFREEVGLPPHAYVNHLRVRLARRLLDGGVAPAEAAATAGFADQAHLTRHFKRVVGVPPRSYQRERGARKNVQDLGGAAGLASPGD